MLLNVFSMSILCGSMLVSPVALLALSMDLIDYGLIATIPPIPCCIGSVNRPTYLYNSPLVSGAATPEMDISSIGRGIMRLMQ